MLIKVNGRLRYFNNITAFNKIAPGFFKVERRSLMFKVEGGKAIGGSPQDWFVTEDGWTSPIACTSLMDALKLIDTM